MKYKLIATVAALLLTVSGVAAQDEPVAAKQRVVGSAPSAASVQVDELGALIRRAGLVRSSSPAEALVPVVPLASSQERTKGASWIDPSYSPTLAPRDPQPVRPPKK